MKFWITLVLVALLGGAAYWWWWRPRDAAATTLAYRTAVAARGEIVQSVAATGQLNPVTTVQVGTEVSGRISKIHVDFNTPVKQGDLLAEIDPATLQARVFQAQAELDSANAGYELRKVNAARIVELRKNQLVSQADYDQTQAELRQQEAAVRIREAALQNAKLDLDRAKIYAPVDGVVISRAVDVGQTVQASFQAPTLFEIAQDLREMEINASVSEADIGGVEPGQPVSFTVDAFAGRSFSGSVRQVRAKSTVTQNVVTYATIITVQNDDLKLLPGMTASVVITTARRPGVIRVPNAALRYTPPDGAAIRAPTVASAGEKPAPDPTIMQELEQIPANMRPQVIERVDANKDGVIDATEAASFRAMRAARMAAGGGSGPGMGGGNGGARRPAAPAVEQTLYVLAAPPAAGGIGSGELIPTTVRVGITDGAMTEIVGGLEENAVVVIGTATAEAVAAAGANQPRNPFMPAFGRGGGQGQRGGTR